MRQRRQSKKDEIPQSEQDAISEQESIACGEGEIDPTLADVHGVSGETDEEREAYWIRYLSIL